MDKNADKIIELMDGVLVKYENEFRNLSFNYSRGHESAVSFVSEVESIIKRDLSGIAPNNPLMMPYLVLCTAKTVMEVAIQALGLMSSVTKP